MEYSSEECRDMRCQCERCENNSPTCCFGRPMIHCPDSADYDPSYTCPGFTPIPGSLDQEKCPACGGSVRLRSKIRNGTRRFRIECNGDCWTETGWHRTIKEARGEWHKIRQEREENNNAAE